MNHRALAGLLAVSIAILTLAVPSPALAQCILSPDSPGQNGQTRLQNFYTLVNDFYSRDFEPTHRELINGKYLQVPPWYEEDHRCDPPNLAKRFHVTSPSRQHYLMNGDQFSELAIVTALGDNEGRMMEIHNTLEELKSPLNGAGNFGLPCWIAEVDTLADTIRCVSSDTATDVTARLGLAYYYAANNPKFLTSQSLFRTMGNDFAERHLQHEYVHNRCHLSSVTGETLCEWGGGGRNTTAGGVLANAEMWIGYYQDVALFLLAAYESTGNPTFLDRAEEVVDQYLIASSFNGVHLTFGPQKFTWNTSVTPIEPQAREAWGDSDAPRALWIGHVLRALSLSSGGAPLTGAYAKLSAWVQLVHASGTQTATTSCIQYNPDGTAVPGNCGTDYYYNGLGAGLHTYHQTSTLDDKLDRALVQYGWTTSRTWNSAACFGIYRGIRPVKALAAAIGLDSTTFGGTACGTGTGGTPPAAPSWLRVDPISQTELKLTWQDNSNNETGFKVERKTGCCGPWTLLPDAPANSTGTATYSNTGLACGTSYAYRVWAVNGAGESAKTNEAARFTNACN